MYGLLLFVMVGAVVWMAADAYHAGRSWGSIISWVLGALLCGCSCSRGTSSIDGPTRKERVLR